MVESSAILSSNTTVGGGAVVEPIIDTTLFGAPSSPQYIADSLLTGPPLESPSTEAYDIFGPDSSLANDVTTTLSELTTTPFTYESVLITSMVLLCFVGYSLILYYYRAQVYSLLSIFRGKMYLNNLLVGQNLLFNHFLRLTIGLGLCTLSVAAFKCVTLLLPQISGSFLDFLPISWVANIIPLALFFAVCVIWLFQSTALQLISRITPNSELLSSLFRLRRLFFALATIVSTPLVLFFIFSDGMTLIILLSIYFILSIFVIIVFVIRTLLLFMGEGGSILYWILYLCAVEFFPVSFFIALALRS